jgi:UDP-MurNAc hydroxylase
MKVTYLKSSTVVVEANGVRILMDPWLVDGEYYGSWAHYPPFEWDDSRFGDIDYIYVSHIHPDHLSPRTMARLPKSIPVLIHRYEFPFLKRNIEMMGFEVRELPHNQTTRLGSGVSITILAADDCDPMLCAKFMGCVATQTKLGSTQLDSLCVVTDGRHVLVNTNDCLFGLAQSMLPRIANEFGKVDFLLTGYSGAGPYPQCFSSLSVEEKQKAGAAKKVKFLNDGIGYIKALSPRFVMPFAGTYILAGPLSRLNDLRGVPEIEEAGAYFENNSDAQSVLLNSGESFDIGRGAASAPYRPTDVDERSRYIENELSSRRYVFEDDAEPSDIQIGDLLVPAFERMTKHRTNNGFTSEQIVYIDLGNDHLASLPMNGRDLSVVRSPDKDRAYVKISLNRKLLKRILSGPRFAHWDNAEIGSHLDFYRVPNIYERGIYNMICFFHA